MSKQVLVYGCTLAAIVMLLKYLEFSVMAKSMTQELFIGFIALIFLSAGVWVGIKWVNRNETIDASNDLPLKSKEELGISSREMDVLIGISEGLSNRQIAEKLFVSESTIKTHTSNLFSKLNVKRRTQALQKARNIGLVIG